MSVTETDRRPTREADPLRFITRVAMPRVILVLLAVRLLYDASVPLANGDTYFHLRFGHEFLSGDWSLWHPGHPTPYEGARWVPTQWLPEIVMAAVQDVFGLAGVAWLFGLLSIALLLTWYVVARRHCEPIVAALLSGAAIFAAYPGISIRPQVLSFIAATVTTQAWLTAARSGKRPWWLIAMTWVWAMCHGMWPIGIVIGCAAVLGIGIDEGWQRARRLLPIPVAQSLVAALTPVGPALYPAVVRVNNNRSYFSEWASPDFSTLAPLIALLMLALGIILLARAKRVRALDVVFVLGALGGLVYSQRTVPIAVAILVPVIARLASETRSFTTGSAASAERAVGRRRTAILVLGAALALGVFAFVVPHTADKPGVTPTWVDGRLSALPAGTPILDDSGMGGYLLWAHPGLDVYEHGYGDVYTQAQLTRIMTVNRATAGWLDDVRASGARVALLSRTSTLAEALQQQGWRVAQSDDKWDYLTAPTDWVASAPPSMTTGTVSS